MASQGRTAGGDNNQNRYAPRSAPTKVPIDDNVKKAEAAYESWVSQPLDPLSLRDDFPLRPAYGTKGNGVQIFANYIELSLKPDQTLFKYDLIVEPQARGRKLHRVVELLLGQPPLSQRRPFSDFKQTLVLRDNIPDQRINVIYYPEDQNQPGPQATAYHVRIKRTDVLVAQQLLDATNHASTWKSYAQKEPMLHALNTMLHHYPRSIRHIANLEKGAFPLTGNLSDIRELGGGVLAVRGFFSSVRPAASRMLINVNITWKAFYKPGLLHDLHFKTFKDLKNEKSVMRFDRSLEGIRVARLNTGGFPRPICGLATPDDGRFPGASSGYTNKRPQVAYFAADAQNVRFWYDGQKRYVTVREYFEKSLGIPLQHPFLPVVNVGSRVEPVYWPPELCVIHPGQPVGGLLNADQTDRMLKCAVRKPADNFALIESYGLPIVGLSAPSPFMDPNYVRIKRSLLDAEGRFLPTPMLRYTQRIPIRNAAWNAKGHKFNLPGVLQAWTFVYFVVKEVPRAFNGPTAKEEFEAARKEFENGLAAAGIQTQGYKPGMQILLEDEDDIMLEATLARAAKANFDFIWVVVPFGVKTLYDRIKFLGDVKLGLATVVSIDKKVAGKPGGQGRGQYFGNEALKINLKLEGRNQVVGSQLYFANDSDTMILGVDVTHLSTERRKSKYPSVAGVVMCDKYLARYHAYLLLQNKRQEMIPRLGYMVVQMLQKWKTIHNALPRNLLIYRDGVAEGQYQMVRDQELRFIKNACGPIYANSPFGQPRITVIIVTKRHHTRFAPKYDADDKANCRAGLVVDRGITEMGLWNFFLQPHSTLQGTARPGYYTVVHDEIFRSYAQAKNLNPADICQDFTQTLCYTFGRATRAVGICTPAYYADILCDRANCYLRAAPDDAFDNVYDQSSQSDGGSYQISDRDRDRLQALVQTHPRLEDTMFFI